MYKVLIANASKKKETQDIGKILNSLKVEFEQRQALQNTVCISIFVKDQLQRPWKVFEFYRDKRCFRGKIISFERILGLLDEKGKLFLQDSMAQIGLFGV